MELNTTNDNSFCTKVQFQFPISRVFWFFRVLFLKLVLVLLFPLSLCQNNAIQLIGILLVLDLLKMTLIDSRLSLN